MCFTSEPILSAPIRIQQKLAITKDLELCKCCRCCQILYTTETKTPLSYKTNRKIGGNAPSKYLKSLQSNVSFDDLKKYLDSHWISSLYLEDDNFNGFIATHAWRLLNAVENATGKEILGRNTDEVKKFFGRAI